MTVNELISRLQEESDAGRGDQEVLLVHQSGWPLALKIDGIWTTDDEEEGGDDEEEGGGHREPSDLTNSADAQVVWIVADRHPYGRSPYGPSRAFGECY